jgi:hypothetical protein
VSACWEFHLCRIGEHTASVCLDVGIAEDLDRLDLPDALRIRLAMKQVRQGMPTDEEAARLSTIEDACKAAIEEAGGVYVGRITLAGQRFLLALVPAGAEALLADIAEIAAATGYDIAPSVEPDPEKAIYWRDLWPSADDRQARRDRQVLEVLEEQGDDPSAERSVDHFAYFPDRTSAAAFADWLSASGYREVRITDRRDCPDAPADDRPVLVTCIHRETMDPDAIGGHTLVLSRKARELGGEYDGWGAPVVR